MKIVIPTLWAPRGQAYVSRSLVQALRQGGHEVAVLARAGAAGKVKLTPRTSGPWAWEPMTVLDRYTVTLEDIRITSEEAGWGGNIDLVLFNEEYDFLLIEQVKSLGLKTATYLDFWHEGWKESSASFFDGFLCSTRRSYNLIKEYAPEEKIHFIGWGLDVPREYTSRRRDPAFHFALNVGFFGIGDRKGAGQALTAFGNIVRRWTEASIRDRKNPSYFFPSFLLHMQVNANTGSWPFGSFPVVGELEPPGIASMGRVYVYPAKLDGLGLSLLEALACGRPAIATDAPPWNEFIRNGENGWLIPVAETRRREDGIAFPETIPDLNVLTETMWETLHSPEDVRRRTETALEMAGVQLNWGSFCERVNGAIETVSRKGGEK